MSNPTAVDDDLLAIWRRASHGAGASFGRYVRLLLLRLLPFPIHRRSPICMLLLYCTANKETQCQVREGKEGGVSLSASLRERGGNLQARVYVWKRECVGCGFYESIGFPADWLPACAIDLLSSCDSDPLNSRPPHEYLNMNTFALILILWVSAALYLCREIRCIELSSREREHARDHLLLFFPSGNAEILMGI